MEIPDLPLELMLEGLPLHDGLRDTCLTLFNDLDSDCPETVELACLGLHRLAAESMAIALCLEQVATLAEQRLE